MHRLGILTLLGLTLACSSVRVSHVYDYRFDFSDKTTYRWGEQRVPHDRALPYQLIDGWFRESVEAALGERGLVPVETDADLELRYFMGRDQVTKITHYHVGYYGPGWPYWGWWGPGPYRIGARRYDEGSLTLDVLDTDRGTLVSRHDAGRAASKPFFGAATKPARCGGTEAAEGVSSDRGVRTRVGVSSAASLRRTRRACGPSGRTS